MEFNSISYSFTLVSTPFDPEGMCPLQATKNNKFLMKEFYVNESPPIFVRNLIHFVDNSSVVSSKDLCMRNLQYRAEVIFRLATNTLSVTVMSRRLSFFDKMSAFGKENIMIFNTFIPALFFRWHTWALYWHQHPQYD